MNKQIKGIDKHSGSTHAGIDKHSGSAHAGIDIKVYKSDRDEIKKHPLQKNYTLIPPGLTLVVGRTGSGKSNLICNIINKLDSIYDLIYVFCLSPCHMLIDKCPKIDEKRTYSDDNPERLQHIIDTQKKYIKENSFKKAPHILVILDDVVQSSTFLRHKSLRELAFAGTHSKFSTIITSQHYMGIPRSLRINCHSMVLLHGLTDSELDRFVAEYQSCYMKKKEFIDVIKYVLDEEFSFLFVNCTCPNKKQMFRKGFDTIVQIN